jgi:uncharacterized RDD family membrane protein YckC
MSDPNRPQQNPGPYPSGPPTEGFGGPPAAGWGPPPPGQQYAQPAAQPYTGGYYGPDWVPELGMQLGGVGARIGAKAIDMVIVFVINLVISVAGVFAFFAASEDVGSMYLDVGGNLAANAAIYLLIVGVDFLYNVVLVARTGGQPGKLMVGLRIVRADGAPLDLRTAFMRWLPVFVLGLLAIVPIVGLVASLARFTLLVVNLVLVCSDGRRQSLFDKLAGTYVVVGR